MFQGATALNLDAKGRMAVPSRHRDALLALGEGRLVLTAHPHRCLLLYPAPAWEPIRDKILKAPSFDPRSAALKRIMVGNARVEEVDGAGRLLIAAELREHAQLEKQVWLVGMEAQDQPEDRHDQASSPLSFMPIASSSIMESN